MILRKQTTTYLVRCQVCGRVGRNMYHLVLDGKEYSVCSPAHAQLVEDKQKDG